MICWALRLGLRLTMTLMLQVGVAPVLLLSLLGSAVLTRAPSSARCLLLQAYSHLPCRAGLEPSRLLWPWN